MNSKTKSILLLMLILASISLVGCKSKMIGFNKNYTQIEKVAMTVLDTDELVSIKETEIDKKVKNKSKKDLTITLNLSHSTKTVALDNALLKSSHIILVLEETFKELINDYKFVINTTILDVYGNEQKVKILEIAIKDSEVEKINFKNFDYKNLEQIAQIKKFNYLKEEPTNNEELDKADEVNEVTKEDSKEK